MKRRMKSIVKGLLRSVAMPMARAVARYGPVKRTARALLRRMPGLERRVDGMLGRTAGLPPLPPRRVHVPQDGSDLSPATEAYYRELKRHFERRKP